MKFPYCFLCGETPPTPDCERAMTQALWTGALLLGVVGATVTYNLYRSLMILR